MLERLRYRVIGSVLAWDLALTLVTLYIASHARLVLEFGLELPAEAARLPWQLYLAVALIWLVVFLLLIPQRALFTRSLLEATSRLIGAVILASASFAGLLYLSLRDISRLQFLYFVALNLGVLLLFHLGVRAYAYSRNDLHTGAGRWWWVMRARLNASPMSLVAGPGRG